MDMGQQGRGPIISLYWTLLKLHSSYKVLKAYRSRLCAQCTSVLTPKIFVVFFFFKLISVTMNLLVLVKQIKNTTFPKRRKPRSGVAGG